jgi:hypothetical protein
MNKIDSCFKQAEKPIETASERAGLTPIKDAGHIILKCSNCGKELVDIWITHPDMSVLTTIVAQCCFCGDKSFSKKIDGIFHVGPVNGVNITDFLTENDIYIIKTGITT